MIECIKCESPQFLQITESRTVVSEDGREIRECEETYECTVCGSVGWIDYDGQTKTLEGRIRDNEKAPANRT